MLKQAQQFALSRQLETESIVAREEALDTMDPLVRLLVRRRIAKLERRAELLTLHADPQHRARLAYLLGDGREVALPDDVDSVRTQAEQSRPPDSPGRKGPWLSALCIAAILASAGAVFAARSILKPKRPETTPAAQLLGQSLPRFVVAVLRDDTPLQTELMTQMTGPLGAELLGVRSANELAALLRSTQALHAGKGSPPTPLLEAFQNRAVAFDKSLADATLPFFVDADTATLEQWPEPVLQSYYVQRESSATNGATRVRVLQLWRLDKLNVRHRVLGYTRATTPAAIVLLDQVESDLVRFTLPAASSGGTLELVDANTRTRGEAWVSDVETQAAKVVGSYYKGLGALSDSAAKLAELLGRRKELLRKWDASLRGQGLELNPPTGLFADADLTKVLGLRVPRAEREEWDAIEDELHERMPSFEALRDRFVLGVERHEVQHRLDYQRGLIPVPASLCGWLGLENPLDAPLGGLAARARDETSAYLAELTRNEDSPLLELVILSNFVLDQQARNAPYTYAALAVYAALAKALGIDVDAVLGRSISRQRFARLAVELWSRPPDELREAARRAYLAEFGVELPSVKRENGHENARYRPEP
ncbi:MAG TPA: hypothetical protein VFQ35_13370 [Polyangiaceae bacterium]|nr:hypothetical protein [Polyangiaceae bacterium]